MSISGQITVRGHRLTLYRPTYDAVGAGSVRATWAQVAVIRASLESVTAELAQRVFGSEPIAIVRAYVRSRGTVPVTGDAVVIETGPFAGTYRVGPVLAPVRRGPNALTDVALVSTAEVIPAAAPDDEDDGAPASALEEFG